ncbi:MAG TPA: hypothetical protein VGA13_05025 [Acidimicrobiales bacterium]|jgi:hypothetical protein
MTTTAINTAQRLTAARIALTTVLWHRLVRDESGEGVISAAIAVLIMSFLGALMWVGFRQIWGDAETNTRDQVGQIGS